MILHLGWLLTVFGNRLVNIRLAATSKKRGFSLNLFILIVFLIHIDTISKNLSSFYVKDSQVKISKL